MRRVEMRQESVHSAANHHDGHAAEARTSASRIAAAPKPAMPPQHAARVADATSRIHGSLNNHADKLGGHAGDLRSRANRIDGPQTAAKKAPPPPKPPPHAGQYKGRDGKWHDEPKLEPYHGKIKPLSKKELEDVYWAKISAQTGLDKLAKESAKNAPGAKISGKKFLSATLGPHIATALADHKVKPKGIAVDAVFLLPWDRAARGAYAGTKAGVKGAETLRHMQRGKKYEQEMEAARARAAANAGKKSTKPKGKVALPDSLKLPNGRAKPNAHLAGDPKGHPKTGIVFDKKGNPKIPAKDKVRVKPSGDRAVDKARARAKLEQKGRPQPPDTVLHHDGKNMAVVDKHVHEKTGHAGSHSVAKANPPKPPGPVKATAAKAATKTADVAKKVNTKPLNAPKPGVAQAVDAHHHDGKPAPRPAAKPTPPPPKPAAKPAPRPAPPPPRAAPPPPPRPAPKPEPPAHRPPPPPPAPPRPQAASAAAQKSQHAQQAARAETQTRQTVATRKK